MLHHHFAVHPGGFFVRLTGLESHGDTHGV